MPGGLEVALYACRRWPFCLILLQEDLLCCSHPTMNMDRYLQDARGQVSLEVLLGRKEMPACATGQVDRVDLGGT